jgi:hypothetical protein
LIAPKVPNPASAAARTGSGDFDCWAAIDPRDSGPPKKSKLNIVPRAPASAAARAMGERRHLRLVPQQPRHDLPELFPLIEKFEARK